MDDNVANLEQKFEDKVFPGTKGDRTEARVKFSAACGEEIAELIASRAIHREIKTQHHFIRDAIIHRLHYWRTKVDPDIARRIDAAIAVDEMAHYEERYQIFVNEIQATERLLDTAWKNNDTAWVHLILKKAAQQVNTSIVPAHLKSQLMDLITKNYQLLKKDTK